MKSGLVVSCTLTAACGFSSPKAGGTPDAPVPLPDVLCPSYSAQLDTCKLPKGFPLTLSGMLTFDTDTGVLKDAAQIEIPVASMPIMTLGAEMRVLLATSVELKADTVLRAQGIRGLAIVASEGITLHAGARIDVSAGGAGYRGSCEATAATDGQNDTDGGAGGGGGGFGANGGDGGNGDADGGQSTGGARGMALAPAPEGPLGGCPGGRGGNGDHPQNVGGAGGLGGGAVYVVSAVGIGIGPGGGIHAGGGGGAGGTRAMSNGDAGGGGGGSGGSIFLEAPRIIAPNAILAANGGGGGEGSGNGVAGTPGAPAMFGMMRAAGGKSGASSGARGGDGGALGNLDGEKTTELTNGGGGGGGGGVGFIRVRSPDAQLSATVSPPAS